MDILEYRDQLALAVTELEVVAERRGCPDLMASDIETAAWHWCGHGDFYVALVDGLMDVLRCANEYRPEGDNQ